MKIEEFTSFARGNGVPCHGDLIETIVNGETYRAEYYIEYNYGHPCVMLAADSIIEKLSGNTWEKVDFVNDDDYNELLSKITPILEI